MKFLRTKFALLAGLGAITLLAVVAYASSTLILAVGTIPRSDFFAGPATVTVRTLTIAPGEVLAWHYHPGYAFNVVKSGVLTVEDGCGGPDESLNPGVGFEEVDGRVHRAKNLGTVDVEVYNTFVVPQGSGTTVNIPNNERRCGPAININECKSEGWRNFNNPVSFSGERECILSVNRRPRKGNRGTTADFDGDGRSDLSVFRPSDGKWYVLEGSTNTYRVQPFGLAGDKMVPGDYDGDGSMDIAIFRPSTGDWWIQKSSNNSVSTTQWGLPTDKPVPADYDGDGKTDIAVYRNGVWYILQSSDGKVNYQYFGLSGDIPIANTNTQ